MKLKETKPTRYEKAITRLGKYLYRKDRDEGRMVGEYFDDERYWKNEARKIVRIVRWRAVL